MWTNRMVSGTLLQQGSEASQVLGVYSRATSIRTVPRISLKSLGSSCVISQYIALRFLHRDK